MCRVVGHLPHDISRTYWFFLHKRHSKMTCEITGHRHDSRYLSQSFKESACTNIFHCKQNHIEKPISIFTPTNLTGFSYTKSENAFTHISCQKIARVASRILSKLISGWVYNRDNAFCRNFGQWYGTTYAPSSGCPFFALI